MIQTGFESDFVVINVLPHLCACDAKRARLVCKTWNAVISSCLRYWENPKPCKPTMLEEEEEEQNFLVRKYAIEICAQLFIPCSDASNIQGVIEELLKFEDTYPPLEIGLNSVAKYYNLVAKGFNREMDLVRLANAFLGINRKPLFYNITNIFVQTGANEKATIVLQMNKNDFI